jgi:hypothetical protein
MANARAMRDMLRSVCCSARDHVGQAKAIGHTCGLSQCAFWCMCSWRQRAPSTTAPLLSTRRRVCSRHRVWLYTLRTRRSSRPRHHTLSLTRNIAAHPHETELRAGKHSMAWFPTAKCLLVMAEINEARTNQ